MRQPPALLLLLAVTLAAAPRVALALSEWWTPPDLDCPTFDSEQACQAYCRADPKHCGGAAECTSRTGEKRPEC
jgi:hypothetical protein